MLLRKKLIFIVLTKLYIILNIINNVSKIRPKTKVYSLVNKTIYKDFKIKVGTEGIVVGVSEIDGLHPKYKEMVLILWNAIGKKNIHKKLYMYCHMSEITTTKVVLPKYNKPVSSYKKYLKLISD